MSTTPLDVVVDDLTLEQIVVLAEASESERVGPAWVDAIVSIQCDDGRWQWLGL